MLRCHDGFSGSFCMGEILHLQETVFQVPMDAVAATTNRRLWPFGTCKVRWILNLDGQPTNSSEIPDVVCSEDSGEDHLRTSHAFSLHCGFSDRSGYHNKSVK